MKDEVKTKAQLIDELAVLRQRMQTMRDRIDELEALDTQRELTGTAPSVTWEKTAVEPTYWRFQFPEHPQLREIFAFVEDNYHHSISLNEVAQAFDYSPSYLTSLVRRLTGQTLYQWIVQRRMFQARYLLLSTDLSVYQIAEAVGYLDTGHFVKHFRKLHASPPKTWKEEQRREDVSCKT
ncbi:MAG: AraC family transcriptional regulator [Coleofasciculus sp. C1-SOL-03]|jgi:AraC-like DNA-binding protein|uniref:helix-turn-helix transcriptional regulator n=1 Tax=Coleofasciculus sp. C1-SOL-03 TaxID=3069522 RepID=UPI0032F1ED9A